MSISARFAPILASAAVLAASPALAARTTHLPVSDQDDGQLVDGTVWDWRGTGSSVADLLLTLGVRDGSTYENAHAFALSGLAEGATPADVRLRMNQQGSSLGSGLTVEISGALDLDPLATPGDLRFSLPRTTARVFWNLTADWDSSGQRIAKYAETPDLSPVLQEILAQPGWDGSPKVACLFLEVSAATGDAWVRYDDTHPAYWNGGNPGIEPARLIVSDTFRDAFHGRELLCRPTQGSVQVNIVPHADTDAFVEWGTDSTSFANATAQALVPADTAHEFLLDGLAPDTRYLYRLVYRPAGSGSFETGPVRSFVSLPTKGQEARICMTSDIHVTNQLALGLESSMSLLEASLDYIPTHSAEPYHLWIDLGDLVVIRAQRVVFDQEEAEQRYRTAREYIDRLGHSVPFVFVRGNHEEVNGWDDDGSADNSAVWSGKMLLKYLAPPLPGTYVSGNDAAHPEIGIPGDYFAFDVGNIRLRALDPYLFSLTRPHNGHGETGGSRDPWDWTIGDAQYQWLYDDFQTHHSAYSLTMLHHLTSSYAQPGYYYGRGGIEVVDWSVAGRPTFEWGGEDSLGAQAVASKRPSFSHGSIHDMLVNAGNQVVVKGHEHFHARQQLDGMVYLTLAKPDDAGDHTGDLWGWRWATFYPEEYTTMAENSGFVSIVADDASATYEYVQTWPESGRGSIVDSFTILPAAPTGADLGTLPAVRRTWIRNVIPNPARIAPRIEYELGRSGPVRLTIHDVAGRLVREVVSGEVQSEGTHSAYWDTLDRNGRRVAAGTYFARLSTGEKVESVKLILVK